MIILKLNFPILIFYIRNTQIYTHTYLFIFEIRHFVVEMLSTYVIM